MHERRSNFDYEDLLACGRGELFAEGPQLPLPPMLMFDRISEIAEVGGEYGKGLVRAVLDLKPDLWFFPCHFKGDPVMPGCLGLDALWQLLGFFLGWLGSPGKGRALGMGEIKFSGQVLPTMKKIVYGIPIGPWTRWSTSGHARSSRPSRPASVAGARASAGAAWRSWGGSSAPSPSRPPSACWPPPRTSGSAPGWATRSARFAPRHRRRSTAFAP